MKRIPFLAAACLFLCTTIAAKDYTLVSPSGDLRMNVKVDTGISYSLSVNGTRVLDSSKVAMSLSDGTVFGANPKVVKVNRGSRDEQIEAPFYRNPKFRAKYNYMTLRFDDDFSLQFRAYNDGVAYRFATSLKEQITVHDETVEWNFSQPFDMYVPYAQPRKDRYESSFESVYTFHKAGQSPADSLLAFMPVLVDIAPNGWLHLMESNVEDYPGAFLKPTPAGFAAEFPPIPEEYTVSIRGVQRPVKYTHDIAWTQGTRNYPWRIIAYSRTAKDITKNNMVYQTSAPCALEDFSWVNPGLSTWDWWNDFTLSGVDFKAGINTETYKFHIDFAASHNIPYTILDEGWYINLDPFEYREGLDMEYLFGYAQESDVKLILWISSGLFWKDCEHLCEYYSKKGVAGFKVDFFDAQDQETVKQLYDMARIAAKHHLVLDFHGIYKPTGLSRAYPNVLNYEGVFGLETVKWDPMDGKDFPRHEVLTSFIRGIAGPLDFTPGAMTNVARPYWRPCHQLPASIGTRARQIAQYIVFDAPLAMLCDSPTAYLRDVETLDYITSIPTVTDSYETLMGEVGEYHVVLRRTQGKFLVGGITDSEQRDVTVDFSFLPDDGEYKAVLYSDGINADKVGTDHTVRTVAVTKGTKLPVHMAPAGGFAIIIVK